MDLDLLSMQRLGDDIVNRKLPRLWRLTLCLLSRPQTDAITQSMSSPDTCSHWGDNRAPASPWRPLDTSSAMSGRATGLKEAHESIELLEFHPLRCTPSLRQDAFLIPDDDSFDFTSLTTHSSNNHDTRSAAHGKRVAHSQLIHTQSMGEGLTVLETLMLRLLYASLCQRKHTLVEDFQA
jgi:hypothetical protein